MPTDIKIRSIGKWKGILLGLGLPMRALSGKHGPCPICNGGDDRFRFDDLEGNGTFFCSKCGAGRGVELVMRWKRVEFKEAVALIEGVIGSAMTQLPRAGRNTERDKAERMALWSKGRRLDGKDPASRYLAARGLEMAAYAPSLRIVDALPYYDEAEKQSFPAMLAKFAAHDQSTATIHRTWLMPDGSGKAPVKNARRMIAGPIPPGGAVRLSPAEAVMGIAEGIETALAAEQMHDIPVWATTSAGALVKWIPPVECREVVIFGDSDASFTGQSAAYSLAFRLKNDTNRPLKVTVSSPRFEDRGFNMDWNDALKAEQRMAA